MKTTKNYVAETKAALQFAAAAHAGQLRAIGADLGKPYFDTHVLRVVAAVPTWARPAAALHDVLEDTPTLMEHLIDTGNFRLTTLQAVDLLTRSPDPDVTYADYIDHIASTEGSAGIVARAVKLADLADNLATLPDGSLRGRYVKAMSRIATKMEVLEDI
jgi:(p)ppGpp synthase/HD superfamily hydrolase